MRQNEDMRKISAYVAMAAVPTLIAGIYGMNFDHMPELRWELGYPVALALMASIVGFLFWLLQAGRLAVGRYAYTAPPWRTTASSARSWRASCPREIVQEDEHTIAFMDLNPWTRGHALVVPRRHSRNLYEVDDEDLAHAAVAAKRLALTHARPARCDGVNLLNCCEPAAWQTVFHRTST